MENWEYLIYFIKLSLSFFTFTKKTNFTSVNNKPEKPLPYDDRCNEVKCSPNKLITYLCTVSEDMSYSIYTSLT